MNEYNCLLDEIDLELNISDIEDYTHTRIVCAQYNEKRDNAKEYQQHLAKVIRDI